MVFGAPLHSAVECGLIAGMKSSRRGFCLFLLHLLLASFVFVHSTFAKDAPKSKYFLYVGTYTDKESKGIYGYRWDEVTGELWSLSVAAETTNPSFLAVDPSRRFLYAVNEVSNYESKASGGVTAFAIDHRTGRLSRLNGVASRGTDPCYLSLDKTGKYVLVANYTSGSVAVFPVLKDGRLGASSAFVQHEGNSVNPKRQEGPHAHWIETAANNRFAIVADLGLDEVKVYRFDAKHGTLAANDPPFARLDAGSGPRHAAFAPNGKFVYVVNELGSTITGFSYNAGRGELKTFQTVSTLPKGFSGSNDTAEIHVHPNGKFLFASNRGHDSIVVFAIDQNNGTLSLVDDFASGGKTPRNFEIDPSGTRLFVANQESDNIVVFRIDQETGRLTSTNMVLTVPSPVSLRFVSAE